MDTGWRAEVAISRSKPTTICKRAKGRNAILSPRVVISTPVRKILMVRIVVLSSDDAAEICPKNGLGVNA